MPKSLRELVVDEDVAVAEKPVSGNGLRSLIVDEDVKKKVGGNGLQDGLTNTPSRFQLSLSENTDEQNPYSQLLNTHKDNTTASLEVSKFNLEKDFNDRQSKINASPLLQQFDKPLDEGLSLSQAKGEAGNVVGIANPNMSVADYNKSAIFSNPQALKKYRQIRESEINANTSKLKQDESELPEAHRFITKDAQAEYFKDNPAYQQLQSAITKNKDQKDELKKSVANIAKIIVPETDISKGIPIDIKKIGEDYLKVVGDPQVGDDAKTLHAIDKGLEKSKEDIDRSSQNIQYKFFKTGANVLSDYYINHSDDLYKKAKPKIEILEQLFNDQQAVETDESKGIIQNHINDYLQDDDVKNYIDATRKAVDYYTKSQNAAKQFPQVQRAINRQKVNDAFYELNKIKDDATSYAPFGAGLNALHYVFGATPSKEQIPLLASMTGLSEDEAKNLYDEKIKGYIGEAPTGIRIDGLLEGLAKGTDETLAKSAMGIRRFLNTDDVEVKNRLLNDRLINYNLEAQKNKIKDDFSNWNINPYSIFSTMGNGIGQTAIYGLPALATGGFTEGALLKDGKFLANLSKKIVEGSATVATGYAGSYEDSYKEAAKYTDDEKLRRAYANITAYENALPELLLSPAEIIKKVGIGKAIGGETFEAFAKDAAENGIEKTVSQRLVKSIKEFANVVGAENIEEQTTNVANIATKKSQLGVETSPQDAINQAIETAVQTTITTLPLGIGAGMNANNDESGIRKEGLFEAGNEPDLYKEKLKSLLDKGILNQEQYNKKVQVVNTMQNIVAAVNKTTKANGKPLTYDEKANLAAQQFRIDNNNFILKNNPITANEKIIEADNNEALNIQNEILIGKQNIGTPEEISQPIELNPEITNEPVRTDTQKADTVETSKVIEQKGNAGVTGVNEQTSKPSIEGKQTETSTTETIQAPTEQVETKLPDTFEEFLQGEKGVNDYFVPREKAARERWINGKREMYERLKEREITKASTEEQQPISKPTEQPKEVIPSINNEEVENFKKKYPNVEEQKFDVSSLQKDIDRWAENNKHPQDLQTLENLSKKEIDKLPPIILGKYNGKIKIIDGWHRIYAALKQGKKELNALIEPIDKEKITPPLNTEQRKESIKKLTIKQRSEYVNAKLEGKGDDYLQNINKPKLSEADISNEVLKDDKNVGDYVSKAKTVLESLYPNAKLEVYDNEKEYKAAGGETGTRGVAIMDKNGKHRILLNLELIKNDNSGKTAFHEVIHPIVYDAFGVNAEKIIPIWNEIATSMKDVTGMEKVFEHASKYSEKNIAQEGITELLTQVAAGKIDLSSVPKSAANKIIDIINKLFNALGINIKLNSVSDFHSIAENIKTAFETGNVEGLKDVIKGKNIDKYIAEYEKKLASKDLSPEEFNDKVRELKDEGFSDEEIKAALQKRNLSDEKINEILSQSKTEKNASTQSAEQQQASLQQGSITEHARTEQAGSEGTPASTEGGNRNIGSEGRQQEEKSITVQTNPKENAKEEIDGYKMSTSDEVNKFLSGETIDDVFGEAPEGEQSYYVQKLTDMLQDGKNMIAKAMSVWGNNISEYGKPLFQYIQNMSNDNQLTNKKAVLLATFLGELKESIIREPERAGELRLLNNAVESYYQNFMNIKGKEVVAGRLLRLYRDKYIGDIFADRILEEKEIKDKRNILKAEQDAKKIDDLVAEKVREQLTAQQKKDADAADKKSSDKDKKANDKKKSLSQKEAQAKADKKLSEIKDRLGKDGDKGLIGKINDLINKLNCK